MLLPEPLADPDNLEFVRTYKTRVGTDEQWQYKDRLCIFSIIDSRLYSITFKNFNGDELTCMISNYKNKATSSLIKKPSNVK